MQSSESQSVIGPSNTLIAGVYVSPLKPGNFTRRGSDGVNVEGMHCPMWIKNEYLCLARTVSIETGLTVQIPCQGKDSKELLMISEMSKPDL